MELNFVLKHKSNSKGAVILFHGLTGSPYELKKYGQFLYNDGYDIYAKCLPGHGDKADDIYTVKYQDWLEFGENEFLELEKKYDNVFVSGLCLGAVIALNLAEKFQNRVKGVISLSTTLFLDGWRLPWYSFLIPLGLSTILRFYYSYPECEPHGIKNERVRSIVKKLLQKGDVGMNDFPMTGIYELLKLSKLTRKNLSKIVSPILLIHSEEDDLTSVKSAKIVYNKISSSDKEMVILKDSYHMVLYDNEKDFVFNKALEFLQVHTPSETKKEPVCL